MALDVPVAYKVRESDGQPFAFELLGVIRSVFYCCN